MVDDSFWELNSKAKVENRTFWERAGIKRTEEASKRLKVMKHEEVKNIWAKIQERMKAEFNSEGIAK